MSKYPLVPGTASYEIVNTFVPARKVNYIIKFFTHPCAAPWYVYAELLAPAFAEMIITLIDFGEGDILRMAAGRPQKRFVRKIMNRGIRVPPKWGQRAVAYLWKVDFVVQKALFWWMIADLTVDGLYKWTTMVNETIWCTGHGILQAESPGGTQPCQNNWQAFVIPDVIQNTIPWFYDGAHVPLTKGSYHCIVAMDPMRATTLQPYKNFQMRITVVTGGETLIFETEPQDLILNERTNVMLTATWRVFPNSSCNVSWSWRIDNLGIPSVNHGEIHLVVGQESNF